jgi:hypothetical protein
MNRSVCQLACPLTLSLANKQPWENLIGMGPEGLIISDSGLQKALRRPWDCKEKDVRGSLGLGVRSLPVRIVGGTG